MENLFITLVVMLVVMIPALGFALLFTALEKICSKFKKFEDFSNKLF